EEARPRPGDGDLVRPVLGAVALPRPPPRTLVEGLPLGEDRPPLGARPRGNEGDPQRRPGRHPWTAILDADGKVLTTSNDAEGHNVGFPSTQPGIEHFAAMLRKTSTRLTEGEIEKLLKALLGR